MTDPQRSTCLVCDRPPHIRGLCPRCYTEARTAINDDVTTEAEIVERGLMLPPHSRKKVGPLMAALTKSRADALAEHYPNHVVCEWIGNSEAVAAKHYLQTTDDHFAKASAEPTCALQKALPTTAETRSEAN